MTDLLCPCPVCKINRLLDDLQEANGLDVIASAVMIGEILAERSNGAIEIMPLPAMPGSVH
jgi:hypothetical protein